MSLRWQVLSIMYLRMQSVEQDSGSVEDVGDTSAGVATDVIVTLVLGGVNAFIVLLYVCKCAAAHLPLRYVLIVATVGVPRGWRRYLVSIVRKVKAAAAREAVDAKRRKQAREGHHVSGTNPMRRRSRAVHTVSSGSGGRGRRGANGARRLARRGNVGAAATPLPSTPPPAAASPNKRVASKWRAAAALALASKGPGNEPALNPLANPRLVSVLNAAMGRAAFAPRVQSVPDGLAAAVTATSRRAERKGRRRSTLIMSSNPLLADQPSAAAAAAAGRPRASRRRVRRAALRGRRTRGHGGAAARRDTSLLDHGATAQSHTAAAQD